MAVPYTLPSPDGGHGCPVMSWAMLKWLKQSGHDVSLFAFAPTTGSREPKRALARRQIQSLGVPLFEPDATQNAASQWRLRLLTARKLMRPRVTDYFPDSMRFQPQWKQTVETVRPDAFWLYTTDAVALSHGTFPQIPRLASLVDLDHEARAVKRAIRPGTLRNRFRSLAENLQDRLLPEAVTEYLNACNVIIEHSVASAQWLNQRGIPARYLPNPVESNPLPADWRERREECLSRSPAKRILMVGYLRGVATQTGLHLLADEVLPALTNKLGASGWEVHIVGGGELTPSLQARLGSHPCVKLRGYVEDLEREYQQAHLNLVAVSEKLGFRTRLIEAFAYASPSVVHANNRFGMPELLDGQNCLLGANGRQLADAIIQLLGNDQLRQRLEQNARRTFEEKLSVPVVMNQMYELLRAAVTRRPLECRGFDAAFPALHL